MITVDSVNIKAPSSAIINLSMCHTKTSPSSLGLHQHQISRENRRPSSDVTYRRRPAGACVGAPPPAGHPRAPGPRPLKIFFGQTQICDGKNRDSSLMFEFLSYVSSEKNPGSGLSSQPALTTTSGSFFVCHISSSTNSDRPGFVCLIQDPFSWTDENGPTLQVFVCHIHVLEMSGSDDDHPRSVSGSRSPYVSYEELPGRPRNHRPSLKSPTIRVRMCHTAIAQHTTGVAEVLDFLSNFW